MVVVRRLKGGSYVLAEMDGSLSKLRFTSFRLVPYHAHDRRSTYVYLLSCACRDQPRGISQLQCPLH